MKSSTPINSYYPEHLYFEHKQEEDERICTEDLAIVDTRKNCRILAARGIGVRTGEDLFQAFQIPQEELPLIYGHLLSNPRILWVANGRPLLFFGDWLSETGLLLVIRPNGSVQAICEVLREFPTERFAFPQSYPSERRVAKELRAAYEVLTDIFSYTDVIFSQQSIPMHRLLLTVAKFAGCHIHSANLFSTAQGIPTVPSPRTTAYLICSLLFLRDQSGIVDATLPYRIALQQADRVPSFDSEKARPAFAELPCFHQFDIRFENGAVIVMIPAESSHRTLSANDTRKKIFLCIRAHEI